MPITQDRLISVVTAADELREIIEELKSEIAEAEQRLNEAILYTSQGAPLPPDFLSSLETFLYRTRSNATIRPAILEMLVREQIHFKLMAKRNERTREYARQRRAGEPARRDGGNPIRRPGSATPANHRAPGPVDLSPNSPPRPSRKGLILPDFEALAQATQFDEAFVGDPTAPDLFGGPPEGRGGEPPLDDLPLDLTYAQAKATGRFSTSELNEMFPPDERGDAPHPAQLDG